MNTEEIYRACACAETAAFTCVVAHETYRRLCKMEAEGFMSGLAEKARAALLPLSDECQKTAEDLYEKIMTIIENTPDYHYTYEQRLRFAACDAKNATDALREGKKQSAREKRQELA